MVSPTPPPADNVPLTDSTSLSPGNYVDAIVLDKTFRLLTNMINTMQSAAAAQASRLTFLTNWQTAYTDSMNQIHAFIQGNGDAIDGTSQTDQNLQSSLNQVNSTYTEQMRANQSTVSDAAKALQSAVNQSTSAVTTQSNLATSILQQMSTILATIFK